MKTAMLYVQKMEKINPCENCKSSCSCGKEKKPHYHDEDKIALLCKWCQKTI